MDSLTLCFLSFSLKREKNTVVASQRRLERKLKDLNLTLDEERQSHTEQRDQVDMKTCLKELTLINNKLFLFLYTVNSSMNVLY